MYFKRFFFLGFLLMPMLNAKPQQQIAQIDSHYSTYFDFHQQDIKNGEKVYRLFIASPKQSKKPLSVLYLLDGNAHFPLAVNSVDTTKNLPLIVAIGYPISQPYAITERERDYTPKAEGKDFSKGGQAVEFLDFLANKIKPLIQQHYHIDLQKQYFFGHSFGGLFGVVVLFNRPDLFQYYTIASPSLWWGNGIILPSKPNWILTPPRAVLVTLGEYEESPKKAPNIDPIRIAKIQQRQQILPTRQFAKQLEKYAPTKFQLYPAQDHGGAILPALQETIKQIQQ